MPLPKDPKRHKEWIENQREKHKGRHTSPATEFKKGEPSIFKGKHHTGTAKEKLSKNHKGMRNSIGTEFKKGMIPWNKDKKLPSFTKEWRENISRAKKGKTPKNIELLYSPRSIKKALRRRIPTSLEEKFQEIVDKYNLPYKFVGDGSFTIERYNPDFVNTDGKKIAIEVYARYYKKRDNRDIEQWKQKRNRVFGKYGWEIIYFNEIEVNEESVLQALGR